MSDISEKQIKIIADDQENRVVIIIPDMGVLYLNSVDQIMTFFQAIVESGYQIWPNDPLMALWKSGEAARQSWDFGEN